MQRPLPLPASTPDATPRWCVQCFPCVGQASVELSGFDGDGYRIYRWEFPLDEDLEPWRRLMLRCVEARRDRKPRSSTLPSALGLVRG